MREEIAIENRLATGGPHTMARRAQHLAIFLLAAIAVLGLLGRRVQRPTELADTPADIGRLAARAQCKPSELEVQRIGWFPDLPTAFAAARKTGRPVFAVTGDGDMCTGRL